MSAATDDLRADHELILDALEVLAAMARSDVAGKAAPAEDWSALLAFFRGFADVFHHGKEEEELFPAMVAAGFPQRAGPIAVMLSEHEQGRRLVGAIESATDPRTRAEAAQAYVALLTAHIQKENEVLFVMADRALSDTQQAALQNAFAASAAALDGGRDGARVRILELRGRFPA